MSSYFSVKSSRPRGPTLGAPTLAARTFLLGASRVAATQYEAARGEAPCDPGPTRSRARATHGEPGSRGTHGNRRALANSTSERTRAGAAVQLFLWHPLPPSFLRKPCVIFATERGEPRRVRGVRWSGLAHCDTYVFCRLDSGATESFRSGIALTLFGRPVKTVTCVTARARSAGRLRVCHR